MLRGFNYTLYNIVWKYWYMYLMLTVFEYLSPGTPRNRFKHMALTVALNDVRVQILQVLDHLGLYKIKFGCLPYSESTATVK